MKYIILQTSIAMGTKAGIRLVPVSHTLEERERPLDSHSVWAGPEGRRDGVEKGLKEIFIIQHQRQSSGSAGKQQS